MIFALPIVTAFGVVSTAWWKVLPRNSGRHRCCSDPESNPPEPRGIGAGPRLLLGSRPGAAAARRSALPVGPWLRQRLHQDRQDLGRGNVAQRPRDRLGELNVGVELRDQFADERHVDRAGDDMNPVRPHVRGDLDLADHDGILGKRRDQPEFRFLLRLRRRDHARHDRTHALDAWDRARRPGTPGVAG